MYFGKIYIKEIDLEYMIFNKFSEELSDVIIDTLIIAESCRINIYDAIQKKIKKNKERAGLTDI